MTILFDELAAREVAFDGFLASWAGQSISVDALLQDRPNLTTIFLKQPPENYILEKINNKHGLAPHSIRNAFWQYYMSKIAIDLICSTNDYDYIIHTRTDLTMKLGTSFEDWFDGSYNTLHARIGDTGFINDQFAVAPAKLMQQAWNHRSVDDLLTMLQDIEKPEDLLQFMLDHSAMTAKSKTYEFWKLDDRRHAL